MVRTFDAPREQVFRAFVDPLAVPKWWGPRGLQTLIDKMDVRPGGLWRFVQKDLDGKSFAFHGVYHDIQPPEKIVQTFEFEGAPGQVSIETIVFEEQDGETTVTDTSTFDSQEDRDAMLDSGKEKGARESMERLAELVEKE